MANNLEKRLGKEKAKKTERGELVPTSGLEMRWAATPHALCRHLKHPEPQTYPGEEGNREQLYPYFGGLPISNPNGSTDSSLTFLPSSLMLPRICDMFSVAHRMRPTLHPSPPGDAQLDNSLVLVVHNGDHGGHGLNVSPGEAGAGLRAHLRGLPPAVPQLLRVLCLLILGCTLLILGLLSAMN